MQTLPSSLRIGVLRGGPSSEYDISLKSGGHVLEQLAQTHEPVDIFISKDGKWHIRGIERSPDRILKHVDVVWNALHGEYGEDGQVQEILERHGVPYTGSDILSSRIAIHKEATKERARVAGIKTPVSVVVRREDSLSEKVSEIFNSIPCPLMVKPTCGGSSLGLYKVNSFRELPGVLETILSDHGSVIVEECIAGKEATCGVVNDFRGQSLYALPPIEIIPPTGKLFDYESKYNGESKEICPGNFSLSEKKEIERLSALIHQTLGLLHYSRSDFIISPRRGIYFLEVNTLPGLTKESLLPKSLTAVGSSMKEFLHHVIGLAVGKK